MALVFGVDLRATRRNMLRVPAWIRRFGLLVALTVAALQLIPAPGTPILAVHAAYTAEEMVVDTTYALDLRVDASLRLLGTSDPAGETELKDIAQRHPSYARAPFYLGLMSQTRGEPEIAVGFYAAALRAGGIMVLGEPQGRVPSRKAYVGCFTYNRERTTPYLK